MQDNTTINHTFTPERRDSLSSETSSTNNNHNQLHEVNPISIHHLNNQESQQLSDKSPKNKDTLQKTKTNASALSDKTLRRSRKERRGLLSNFSIIPEFKDAREYPDSLKHLIVFIISFASMIGPMGTSIVFPAIEDMRIEFQTTTMMINVSVGIYLMSLGVFPLWWSSFSENFGRRSIYIISFTMYMGFAIGCALSPSIKSLIIFRVFSGGCSASVQAVGAGTISDLFATEKRGRALGMYYLGTLMSPLASPIIGSLLLIRWSWRSTQWFLVILAGFIDLCIIFLLPETLRVQDSKAFIAKVLADRRVNKEDRDEESHTTQAPETENDNDVNEEDLAIERIASRASARSAYNEPENHQSVVQELYLSTNSDANPRADEIRQNDLRKFRTNIESAIDQDYTHISQSKYEKIKSGAYTYLFRPLKALNFLRYPPVALSISFSAISFGILYLVNMTIEYEFARDPYNWKSLYIGFAYIPNSVSYIFASVYGGKWTDYLLRKYKEKHGFNAPEARLSWNIFSAIVTFPVALLIIGWCFDFHTFWVTPLIGTALFGYASMMTIGPTVTYIVDSLPGRGATGVALNNLMRQTMATAAVFLTDPMLVGMKTGPTYSLFAGVILISALVLLVIKKKGTYWRENYDLQRLYDSLD